MPLGGPRSVGTMDVFQASDLLGSGRRNTRSGSLVWCSQSQIGVGADVCQGPSPPGSWTSEVLDREPPTREGQESRDPGRGDGDRSGPRRQLLVVGPPRF